MFTHVFKNTLKVILRQKELVFWSLIFPLILSGLFKMTLGNIDNTSEIKKIDVGVIKSVENPIFDQFLTALQDDLFIVHEVDNLESLENGDVKAIIEYPTLKVKESGIEQSIVEMILNRFKQVESTLTNHPEQFELILNQLTSDISHIHEVQTKEMKFSNIYFYTLVGMQSMYGYMFGLQIITQFEGNLSVHARRQLVAPIKKSSSIFSALLVGWLIHAFIMLVSILFMDLVLNVGFGPDLWRIILLVLVGSWTGVALGVLIGASNKMSFDSKIGIGIVLSMTMSFLAGMMVAPIRMFIQNTFPILAYINPVHVITNALYSLYYYDGYSQFWFYFSVLSAIAIGLSLLSLLFVRGKQYESL